MYWLFCGDIPKSIYVCHHCDNPRCCRPDHLFLGTNSENILDSVAKGRHNGGAHNIPLDRRGFKLNRHDVSEIRQRYAAGETDKKALSREFGVTWTHIKLIVTRQTWKEVP